MAAAAPVPHEDLAARRLELSWWASILQGSEVSEGIEVLFDKVLSCPVTLLRETRSSAEATTKNAAKSHCIMAPNRGKS
eukprot:s1036_g15.t1